MANFYLDNSDLKHHLNHPLMKKLVALRERNYSDAEKYDYAPFNFEDAMDSYEKVLEIAGEISGEIVAANAEDVDHEGPHVVDGHVVYAKGTQKNLDALVKAGLMEEAETMSRLSPVARRDRPNASAASSIVMPTK